MNIRSPDGTQKKKNREQKRDGQVGDLSLQGPSDALRRGRQRTRRRSLFVSPARSSWCRTAVTRRDKRRRRGSDSKSRVVFSCRFHRDQQRNDRKDSEVRVPTLP